MKNTRPINAGVAPKFLVAALLFAACSLLLLPSCHNPLQQRHEPAPGTGTGTLTLSIGGAARTITPDWTSQFERFHIIFTPAAGCTIGNTPIVPDWDGGNITLTLPVGIWDVTASVFSLMDDDYPAAVGSLEAPVTMVPDGDVTGHITLGPITGDGDGVFSWEGLDFPSSIQAASMRIFASVDMAIAGGAYQGFDLLPSVAPFYVELPAGQHYVVFSVTNDDGETAEVGHALHVYRNIDTELPADFFVNFPFFRPAAGSALWYQLAWLRVNAQSGEEFELVLGDDNEISSLEGMLVFGGVTDMTVTITSDARRVISHSDGDGPLFTVGSGVTLVLEDNVTLQGIPNNNRALVVVFGALEMHGTSQITGNVNPDTGLANRGGGVRVNLGGAFTMNGGEIFGNTSNEGGGVFNQGTFTMNAGTIRDNIGTGANAAGGGVSTRGEFTMEGGEIHGNTALWGGGVNTWHGGTFTMPENTTGVIHDNDGNTNGGGVSAGGGGTFIMRGGEIRGNRATGAANSNGGGVHVSGGAPGAALIGTFNMYGGAITGNTAQQGGGGVSNWTNGRFRLHGGTISDNTAGFGGGVINFGTGQFTMSGGVISGNSAIEGGGVNNQSTSAQFFMGGGLIHGINAEYALGNTAQFGVAFSNIPGTGVQAGFTALNPDHTLVEPTFTAFPNSLDLSMDIEGGAGAMNILLTGLGEYEDDVYRLWANFEGYRLLLGGWVPVPATGVGVVRQFISTPGNWTLEVEIAPLDGTTPVIAQMSTYIVDSRTLNRGANSVALGEFTLVPRVAGLTITGIDSAYTGGTWQLHASRDGGTTWTTLPGPALVGGFAAGSLTAVFPGELGEWMFELDLRGPAPGFAMRATYRATLDLDAGINVRPFTYFATDVVTAIVLSDIPSAYVNMDIFLFADGVSLLPTGSWVQSGMTTIPAWVSLPPGTTELRLEFRTFPAGVVASVYTMTIDLATGPNPISLTDLTLSGLTIEGIDMTYVTGGAWRLFASNDGGASWPIFRPGPAATNIGLFPADSDGSIFVSLPIAPAGGEWRFRLELFEGPPWEVRATYVAAETLISGHNVLSFVSDFAPLPYVLSIGITDIPALYGDDDLHLILNGDRISPADGWFVNFRDSISIGVSALELLPGPAELVFEFLTFPAGDLRGRYTLNTNLAMGINTFSLNIFDRYPPRPDNPVTSITITDIPVRYLNRDGDVDFGWIHDGSIIPIDTEVPVAGSITFDTPAWEPGPQSFVMDFWFPPFENREARYEADIDLVAGANTVSFEDYFTLWIPPPPVTSLTIYGLPERYQDRNGEVDLLEWTGLGHNLLALETPIIGSSVTFALNLAPGVRELDLEFWFPPFANPEAFYVLDVVLNSGANYIPFTELFGPFDADITGNVTPMDGRTLPTERQGLRSGRLQPTETPALRMEGWIQPAEGHAPQIDARPGVRERRIPAEGRVQLEVFVPAESLEPQHEVRQRPVEDVTPWQGPMQFQLQEAPVRVR